MMFKNKKAGRMVSLLIIMVLALTMLQGCGGKPASTEELLANMQEFSTPDGSASIYLNKDWITEDVGSDTFITAGSKDGREAVLLMRFPKGGIYPVDSMESMQELVETSYSVSDDVEADPISIPGMNNVKAYTCKVTSDGTTAAGYLVYGETDYAYYSIGFIANKITDKIKASFAASLSKFTEVVPEVENNFTSEMTDTIRWFNAAYAVLTDLNNWDYNLFGGLPANDESASVEQELLKSWWDVTDKASADSTIEWILTEGHRADYKETVQTLLDVGLGDMSAEDVMAMLTASPYNMSSEEAQTCVDVLDMYAQYGETAIDGWDYCRALSLMGYYYLAGYYTEQEALDKSLEIAQTMQPLFGSWDELMDSYLRGYEYWNGESSDERRGIYEDIKTRDDNPYAIDYNLALTKTW